MRWFSPAGYDYMIEVLDHHDGCPYNCGPAYKGTMNDPITEEHSLPGQVLEISSGANTVLQMTSQERKDTPLASGVLDYFPNALAAVARLSKAGNDKHNPGQELHWSRAKSGDHADTIMRHLVDRGTIDPEDGLLHDVKVAWRALALLEEELIRRGATPGRNAR